MSEAAGQVPQTVYPLLKEIVDAWFRRDEFLAAKESATLTFWRDGMVKQLQQIANGQATEATFKVLEKEFYATEKPVKRSIEKLIVVRNKLGASQLSNKIDFILHDYQFGKGTMRECIELIISNPEMDERTMKDLAKVACAGIATLNAEISKLHRMVYPG